MTRASWSIPYRMEMRSRKTRSSRYCLKADQIESKILPLGLDRSQVTFFNSYEDDVEELRTFLSGRILHTREAFRGKLRDAIERSTEALAKAEEQELLE